MVGITAGAVPLGRLGALSLSKRSPIMKPAHNRHTVRKQLLFVGLDVHAKNVTVALAEGARKDSVHAAGGGGEARLYGAIPNDLHAPSTARMHRARTDAMQNPRRGNRCPSSPPGHMGTLPRVSPSALP